MTALKRIETLESLARLIIQEADELKKVLPVVRPVKPRKGDVIARRLKNAVK